MSKTPVSSNANTEQDIQKLVKDILERFQNFIALVIALGVMMIGAGYVVVNSHLWRYTRQHGYALNSNRYLTAGAILLAFVLLLFVVVYSLIVFVDWLDDRREFRNVEGRWFWVIWTTVSIISGVIAYVLFGQMSVVTMVITTVGIIAFRKKITIAVKNPLTKHGGIVFLTLMLYIGLGSFLFGRSFYWRIPHSLGGGQPPVVQLVFESPELLNALQLPVADGRITDLEVLRMSAPSETITDRLCMLAETRDGILVYNPHNRTTLSVKYDYFLSIRDIHRSNAQITEEQVFFNCSPPEVSDDLFGGLTQLLSDNVEAVPLLTPEGLGEE